MRFEAGSKSNSCCSSQMSVMQSLWTNHPRNGCSHLFTTLSTVTRTDMQGGDASVQNVGWLHCSHRTLWRTKHLIKLIRRSRC